MATKSQRKVIVHTASAPAFKVDPDDMNRRKLRLQTGRLQWLALTGLTHLPVIGITDPPPMQVFDFERIDASL
ncbi:hypothetical protein [Verrucomicrobium sp. BvORR106]|uniref:hypothetical protein n=1 Tax=Verrucomicrobium sp. BvORR106 TaxID=1403819 RepID=UPI0005709358|nr:hypothetical protein [Verrucomicrobium sp. BvORR106]